MGKLVETEIIDNDVYKTYNIDEAEKDFTNEYTFPWILYFDQTLITLNDKPKYLIGLYQDGEIWSEEEIWGTDIVDLDTIEYNEQTKDYDCKGVKLHYYITGDHYIHKVLDEICNSELEDIWGIDKNII